MICCIYFSKTPFQVEDFSLGTGAVIPLVYKTN